MSGTGTWISAHALSSRQDLPLPFGYAMAGAVAALTVSFLALGLLWRTSRLRGDTAGRPLPAGLAEFLDSGEVRGAARVLGLLVAGFTAFAALAGPNRPENPAPGLVYVVFWVGLVPASLVFGPVWKYLNPLRTLYLGLAKLTRTDTEHPPHAMPAWLGYWPGALSLAAFVWLELCAPDRGKTPVLVAFFTAYALVQLIAAMFYGPAWFARGDGFEVFSTLIGRLSVLGRRGDGALVLRNPLHGLDGIRAAPGLAAVLAVMLGSTAFDSVTTTPWWARLTYDPAVPVSLLNSLVLAATITGVAAVFSLAARLAAVLAGRPTAGTTTAFAHTLVPIAVGYLIAHYFSLLVYAGHQAIIRASDPLVNGANLFGTADDKVDFSVLTIQQIAVVQVTAVVTGHVLGVFAAHDRSVRIFPGRHAVTSQLPMMVLMIAYTFGGLSLLFAG